jgi:hypothetical protein
MNERSMFVRRLTGSVLVLILSSGCELILHWDPVKEPLPDAGGSAGGSAGQVSTGGTGTDLSGGAGAGGSSGTAGGGGSSAAALSITTTELPKAFFNIAYTFQLATSVGEGSSLVWSLESGALPGGLGFTSSGTLQGVPTETGTFALSLLVRDGSNGEARKTLNLTVSRKRWLAYTSDERTAGQFLLYLVDTASPSLAKTLVTTGVQSAGNVELLLQFSPDGTKLAYAVDDAVDEQYNLYILDVSGDTLAYPQRINSAGPLSGQRMGAVVWSPDSRSIAYLANEGGTDRLRWSSLSRPTPTVPAPVADAAATPCWVSDDVLLWSRGGNVEYSRIVQGAMGSPREIVLSTPAHCLQVDPASQRALLEPSDRSEIFKVLDLAIEGVAELTSGGSIAASWDISLISRATNSAVELYDVSTLLQGGTSAPSAFLAPGSGVGWGSHSKKMAWLATPDGTLMFADATLYPVRGVGLAGGQPGLLTVTPKFTQDDSWVAWIGTDGRVWVAAVDANGPQNPHVISGEHALANETTIFFQMAPNSRSCLYFVSKGASGNDIYVAQVDGSGDPGGSRLNPDGTSAIYLNVPSWSSDSALVGYILQGTNSDFRMLLVFDMSNPGSPGRQVQSACAGAGGCLGVASYAFQP